MSDSENLIGDISSLENGGKALLFSVIETISQGDVGTKKPAPISTSTIKVPAFAVRFQNKIYAFKNRCGHIAVNLDFQPGEFFTEEGDALVCATHGATYAPDTGKCLGGPCFGVGLEPLTVVIEENNLYLNDVSVTLAK